MAYLLPWLYQLHLIIEQVWLQLAQLGTKRHLISGRYHEYIALIVSAAILILVLTIIRGMANA